MSAEKYILGKRNTEIHLLSLTEERVRVCVRWEERERDALGKGFGNLIGNNYKLDLS